MSGTAARTGAGEAPRLEPGDEVLYGREATRRTATGRRCINGVRGVVVYVVGGDLVYWEASDPRDRPEPGRAGVGTMWVSRRASLSLERRGAGKATRWYAVEWGRAWLC